MIGRRDSRGAVAIVFAILSFLILVCCAFAVDLTMQTNRKQHLHDTLDAAAQSGAYALPADLNGAESSALAYAAKHDPSAVGANKPVVTFYCIVSATGLPPSYTPDTTQIPVVCNPGPGPYNTSTYPGLKCNVKMCAIPCAKTAGHTCNTIRVSSRRDVDFKFGQVAGVPKGGTGALNSVACKGSCGAVPPNPMDIAVVADRTGSMSSTDVNAMIAGIKSMLQTMQTSQHYVALGTIGRSTAAATPSSEPGAACPSTPSGNVSTGAWVSVPFSNNYLSSGTTNINTSSGLVKAINCLTNASSTGTALASPFKLASRYLLGMDSNNLGSLPARQGTPTKVLIFETDGQPNEGAPTGGSTTLTTTTNGKDIFSNVGDKHQTNGKWYYDGGNVACNNLAQVAANAKAAGILVITIAYNLSGITCDSNDSPQGSGSACTSANPCKYGTQGTTVQNVTNILAGAASPSAAGPNSAYDKACPTSGQTGTFAENTDGDYFFCAASGSDMASIFKTALSQASGGIKLIRLP